MIPRRTVPNGPNWSAYNTALLRAQHQVVDRGSIFLDPLAVRITGESADSIARTARQFPQVARLRQYIAARSRFAEDSLAKAVNRGVRQVVVLGAGFDTLGLRNPYSDKGVRVFEVDRAQTQALKRQCVNKANLKVPPGVTFVAVDFEKDAFFRKLALAGFSRQNPAFFIWLGVVVYLSRKAVTNTLSAIATMSDAEIVFDYSEPLSSISPEHRALYKTMIERAKASGEPWRTVFRAPEVAQGLSRLGFSEVEDLGSQAIAARYYPKGYPAGSGGHIVRARTSK